MSIKTSFSIKDLENLSGVKAHTIRIWEKRYNLLIPERSDTNIRTYDLENLQKILNVVLLYENGLKVSKIAALNENELHQKVRELVVEKNDSKHAINLFKLAMLNFDQQLFDNTFNQLLTQNSFREIFLNVILNLLEEIGVLWLSKTITPAHEHFITTLIKQKLLINIERVQSINIENNKTAVLFLPMNEIHDIGLLYIHFELLLKGCRSIYLGPSVPMDNLKELQATFSEILYISYFTVEPSVDHVVEYLNKFSEEVLSIRNEKFHVLGRNTKMIDNQSVPKNIVIHNNIIELITQL
jgi:DNA-binding transcriptional MerR regulator